MQQILTAIETALEASPIQPPVPMPGDVWILKSAMQKAIRFGEVDRALQAAAGFWRQDRVGFWRRFGAVIVFEDLGVGDVDAVMQVLAATCSAAWRKRMGDERVALYLVRLLCLATKNRMMDALYILAERDPAYSQLRQRFAQADDETLITYASDDTNNLIERALACWYLAGTKKYPSDSIPPRVGSPQKLVELLHSLPVPEAMRAACVGVMNRTAWPLAVFFPLIWQEAFPPVGTAKFFVEQESLRPIPDVEGIPLYACDMFTRTGQASMRQLQKEVPSLRYYSIKQIGLTLFYLEGGRVDRRFTSESMEAFCQQGEIIDIETNGLDMPHYLHLRECLREHLPVLDAIRTTRLQRMLEGAHA